MTTYTTNPTAFTPGDGSVWGVWKLGPNDMECGGWNPGSIVLDLYKLGQITAPLTQLVFMFVICFKEMIYRLQFIGHPFLPKYIRDRLLLYTSVWFVSWHLIERNSIQSICQKLLLSQGSHMLGSHMLVCAGYLTKQVPSVCVPYCDIDWRNQ